MKKVFFGVLALSLFVACQNKTDSTLASQSNRKDSICQLIAEAQKFSKLDKKDELSNALSLELSSFCLPETVVDMNSADDLRDHLRDVLLNSMVEYRDAGSEEKAQKLLNLYREIDLQREENFGIRH